MLFQPISQCWILLKSNRHTTRFSLALWLPMVEDQEMQPGTPARARQHDNLTDQQQKKHSFMIAKRVFLILATEKP